MTNVNVPAHFNVKLVDTSITRWPEDKPIPNKVEDFQAWKRYKLMTDPLVREEIANFLIRLYVGGRIISVD